MPMQAVGDPLLYLAFRIDDVTALHCITDNAFETGSWLDISLDAGMEHFAITGVTEHKPIFCVVVGKAFGDAFNCLHQTLFTALACVLGFLQRGNVVNPKHTLAADKTDVTAVVSDLGYEAST